MISIVIAMRSLWACKILNREKTIEVRKGLALYNALKKAEAKGEEVEFLMYVTKANPRLYGPDIYKCFHAVVGKGPIPKELNGKIVARFKADAGILEHFSSSILERYGCFGNSVFNANLVKELEGTCLHFDELDEYLDGVNSTALRIRDLEIFDKPKALADYGLKRAPQSWCYAKEAL